MNKFIVYLTRKKPLIFASLFILMFFILSFLFFSSPHYKISTPIRKNLFIVKAEKNPLLSRIKNLFQKQLPMGDSSGICAPPGCGAPFPSGSKERENITLTLSDEQITSLLNQYKPTSVLLNNIKVKISSQTIFASTTSLYPFLPGQVSVSARLYINHFYVNDAYIGNVKAPEKIANFIEANGDKLIKDLFVKYDIWLDRMELVNEKLIFKVNAPKGMIVVNQDGTILINLQEAQKKQNNANENPYNRY